MNNLSQDNATLHDSLQQTKHAFVFLQREYKKLKQTLERTEAELDLQKAHNCQLQSLRANTAKEREKCGVLEAKLQEMRTLFKVACEEQTSWQLEQDSLLGQLEAENANLRLLLALPESTRECETIEQLLARVEAEQQLLAYQAELKKRQEWEGEVERIRVEVATQLQAKFEERVAELEKQYPAAAAASHAAE